MCRKPMLCALMLGLAFVGVMRGVARADDDDQPVPGMGYEAVAGHEEGPQEINTEESISAGAHDQMAGDQKQKVATTPDQHPVGAYMGVEPGGAQSPAVPVQAGKSPATITWPGFQMRPDGTSRVFIQSTSAVEAQSSTADGKFIVKFPATRIAGSTNRLPLETRFFNTPVTRVSLSGSKDGVTLTLDLRAAVTPRMSSERGPTGYYFTYLDLPAGSFITAATKEEAKAAPVSGDIAPPPQPEHMTTLDGTLDVKTSAKSKAGVRGSASIDTSRDNELPPGVKANSKTQAGIKLGK